MTNVPQTVTVNIQLSFWVNSQANIKFKILRIHLISKIKDGYHHPTKQALNTSKSYTTIHTVFPLLIQKLKLL